MLVDVLADAYDLLAGGIPAGLQVGDIGGAQLFIGGMPKGAGRASGQGAQTFSSGLVYSGGRAVLASKLILYNSGQADLMPAYRIGVYFQMLLQQLPVALPDLLWQFMQRLLQFLKKFRGGGNGKLPSVQLRRSWTCLLQLSQENTVQKLFFREQGGKGKIGPR